MARRLLIIVVVVIAALVALVAWLNLREEAGAPAPAPAAAADPARGAYLARVGNCMACHTERGGAPFAGGRAIETPFGTVFSSNLTPHKSAGLGEWTSQDFWRAMHHGRSRDGRLLYPAFPYPNYTLVSREDSDAIFAYLRTLPPVERAPSAHKLRWPYSTQAALAVWRALYFSPGTYRPDGSKPLEWNRGAYLVQGLGHCSACHAPRNALGASSSDMMDLSGGVIPMQNWYAPSLASRGEAGVGDWEHAQVAKLLRTGVARRGTVLGPMAEVVLQSTQYLTDGDAHAMAVFLKDLPQREGEPTVAPPLPQRVAERGALVYRNQCAQCHGDNGEGVADAYPALAGNRAVNLPVTANLVQVVLGGGYPPATAGNPRPFGMPPYATVLSDEDVAAVLSHIRMSWGNRSGAVSILDVTQQRSSATP